MTTASALRPQGRFADRPPPLALREIEGRIARPPFVLSPSKDTPRPTPPTPVRPEPVEGHPVPYSAPSWHTHSHIGVPSSLTG